MDIVTKITNLFANLNSIIHRYYNFLQVVILKIMIECISLK